MEINDEKQNAQITVRLPIELREKLEAFNVTLSKLIRTILEEFVKDYESEK